MIKRLLNFIPFATVLMLNMYSILSYSLTGSIGFIPLIVVGIVFQIITVDLLCDN